MGVQEVAPSVLYTSLLTNMGQTTAETSFLIISRGDPVPPAPLGKKKKKKHFSFLSKITMTSLSEMVVSTHIIS